MEKPVSYMVTCWQLEMAKENLAKNAKGLITNGAGPGGHLLPEQVQNLEHHIREDMTRECNKDKPELDRQIAKAKAEADAIAQRQAQEAQKQAELVASIGADTACALKLGACTPPPNDINNPCNDHSGLKLTNGGSSTNFADCLNWRMQRQGELAAKMKANPLVFALPWSKTDSEDVKLSRYNERLKVLSQLNDNKGVPQLDLLVRQGYADGSVETKRASDDICQRMKQPPVGYLEACGDHEAAEQKRKQEEKAAWDRTPIGRVANAYQRYIFIKYCHDVRDGYAEIYINDNELLRSETATKAIVNKAVGDDPSINTDQQWQSALNHSGGRYVDRNVCQMEMSNLIHTSPVAVFHADKP
jgi:hypothetical protein